VAGNPAKVLKTFAPDQITWRNDGQGEYQRLAREALTDFVETEPLSAPEPDRPRLRSEAIPVRLSGTTAQAREQRAAQQEGMKD